MAARRWAGVALVAAALAAGALAQQGFPALFSKYPAAARLRFKRSDDRQEPTDMWFDGDRALFLDPGGVQYTLLSKSKVTSYKGDGVNVYNRVDLNSYRDIVETHFKSSDFPIRLLLTGGDATWTEEKNPDPASNKRVYNAVVYDYQYTLTIENIDRPYVRKLVKGDSTTVYETEMVSAGCQAVPPSLFTDAFNGEEEVKDTGCGSDCYKNPEGECEARYTTLMANGYSTPNYALKTTWPCKRHLIATYYENIQGASRRFITDHLYVAGGMQRYETAFYGRSGKRYGVSIVTRNGHTFAYQHTYNGPVCMTDGFGMTAQELFMHNTGALCVDDNTTRFVVTCPTDPLLLAYKDGGIVLASRLGASFLYITKGRVADFLDLERGKDFEQVCHAAPHMFTLPSACRWGNKQHWDIVTREPTLEQIVEGTECPKEPEDMGTCEYTTNMPVPWLPCSYQIADDNSSHVYAESKGRYFTVDKTLFFRRDLNIIGKYLSNYTASVTKGSEADIFEKTDLDDEYGFSEYTTWKGTGEKDGVLYDNYTHPWHIYDRVQIIVERSNPLHRNSYIIKEADVQLRFQKIISIHPDVDAYPSTTIYQSYDQLFIAPDLTDASKYCDLLETYPSWNITP